MGTKVLISNLIFTWSKKKNIFDLKLGLYLLTPYY